MWVLIPPRSASSTVNFLNALLTHLASRIIRPVRPSTVRAAAAGFTGWFQERPSTPLTTLPNTPKVAIPRATPARLPSSAASATCTVSAPRSSFTVYPPASSTPVSFMLRRIKFRMLKVMMITATTRMITANSITMAHTISGRKEDPPRMLSQLTAIYPR